jgi:hypothetical protein
METIGLRATILCPKLKRTTPSGMATAIADGQQQE